MAPMTATISRALESSKGTSASEKSTLPNGVDAAERGRRRRHGHAGGRRARDDGEERAEPREGEEAAAEDARGDAAAVASRRRDSGRGA